MATNQDSGGGGERAEDRTDDGSRRGLITPRWLRATQLANREAFEREMERHRRRFDSELQRFWRTTHSAT